MQKRAPRNSAEQRASTLRGSKNENGDRRSCFFPRLDHSRHRKNWGKSKKYTHTHAKLCLIMLTVVITTQFTFCSFFPGPPSSLLPGNLQPEERQVSKRRSELKLYGKGVKRSLEGRWLLWWCYSVSIGPPAAAPDIWLVVFIDPLSSRVSVSSFNRAKLKSEGQWMVFAKAGRW